MSSSAALGHEVPPADVRTSLDAPTWTACYLRAPHTRRIFRALCIPLQDQQASSRPSPPATANRNNTYSAVSTIPSDARTASARCMDFVCSVCAVRCHSAISYVGSAGADSLCSIIQRIHAMRAASFFRAGVLQSRLG